MIYKEACAACKGEEFAFPLPLESLPQARPDPEQETIIHCFAPINPSLSTSWIHYLEGDQREVNISYAPTGELECIKGETPKCVGCRVASIAKGLKSGLVIVSKEELEKNDVSRFTPDLDL